MKIYEIIRKHMIQNEMQGRINEKVIMSKTVAEFLASELSDVFTHETKDTATRLFGMEIEIDPNMADNQFKIVAKKTE